jgi:hypothetical protein
MVRAVIGWVSGAMYNDESRFDRIDPDERMMDKKERLTD